MSPAPLITRHPTPRFCSLCQVVGPPFILGAISTFFGNLPLAFSEVRYISLYFFSSMGMLIAMGVFSAFILIPAKLMGMTLIENAMGINKKLNVVTTTSHTASAPPVDVKEVSHA